jgi:carboxypeptidase C (cathepsin A)
LARFREELSSAAGCSRDIISHLSGKSESTQEQSMRKLVCGVALAVMLSVPLAWRVLAQSPAQNAPQQSERAGRGAAANRAENEEINPAREEWSVTEHTIRVDGQTISYTASAGTTLLHNEQGEPTGLMYSVAYTRSGITDKSTRPISFLYNGGPGSATMWLHMGAFGPRRVSTVAAAFTPPAPYKLVDNTESLLDKTDLVFIDAMGTGYSHAVGKAQNRDFYGIDEDVAAFGQFIETYVNRNDRWNSPKFLIGESYGTFRSAALGNYLQNTYNMHLNGIVLISSVLDLSSLTFGPGDDRVYIYYLPSYAAVAWYHKMLKNRPADLAAFVDEARKYAAGEYATALFKGATLSDAEKHAVAQKLSYFTGLSEDYLMRADLRVTLGQFNVELERSKGLTVGRIDARFTGYTPDLLSESSQGDPEGPAVGGAFTAMLNQYNHDELKFGQDRVYHNSSGGGQWNWTRTAGRGGRGGGGGGFPGAPNVEGDLKQAMITNPRLTVEVENGYFDFATPFYAMEFTVNHLGLPPELQKHIAMKYYPAGHMMYLDDQSREMLHHNIASFIERAAAE